MKIKIMADGLRFKIGGSCQGCLQGDRLHYSAIKSICGNTVLPMRFDQALSSPLSKLGKLAQLVGKGLVRQGSLGGSM